MQGQNAFGRRALVPIGLALFLAGAPVTPARGAAPATAASAPAATRPARSAAQRLADEPMTGVDKVIKEKLAAFAPRLAALKADDSVVRGVLPLVKKDMAALAEEYNLDKGRYPKDWFPAQTCVDALCGRVEWLLKELEAGRDPRATAAGRKLATAVWVDSVALLSKFTVNVPKTYDPARPWPLVLSWQDNPKEELMRDTGYFMINSIQTDFVASRVHLEAKARAMLKDAAREFNIDPLRLYSVGFSNGGHSCLKEAVRFPDWFAAVVPLCSDLRDLGAPLTQYLRNTPAQLMHGDKDLFRREGKFVFDCMKAGGCAVTWLDYPDGHSPRYIYDDAEHLRVVLDFLDKHALDPYPKALAHVVEHRRYARAFWAEAWLVKPDATSVFELNVKDGNRIEGNVFGLSVTKGEPAKVKPNEEIGGLFLFLNDKLVDMSKPVTVVVGGKTLYEGPAACPLAVKILDGPVPRPSGLRPLWEEIAEIAAARRPASQAAR